MPIQFRCSNCGQPIEVDDEYAGRQAACPYCRSVVTVPMSSTYAPQPTPTARPGVPAPPTSATLGTPPPAPLGPFPAIPELTPQQRIARAYGNYALICTALAIGLLAALVPAAFIAMAKALQPQSGGGPIRPSELTTAQSEAMEKALDSLRHKPWFLGLSCGSEVLAVGGLALAIASLVRYRQGNWRAIVALIACGLYVFCLCGGLVFQLVTGSLAPPG